MRKLTYFEVLLDLLWFGPVKCNKSKDIIIASTFKGDWEWVECQTVGKMVLPESSLNAERWSECGRYLLRNLIVRYVSFDSEWPFKVKGVLVQLHQEHNQYKQCIDHKEWEDGRVSQFSQIPGNTCLKLREDYHQIKDINHKLEEESWKKKVVMNLSIAKFGFVFHYLQKRYT